MTSLLMNADPAILEESAEDHQQIWADEIEYSHIKMQYANRKALMDEAVGKKKVLAETTPADPLYHRYAVSAEMAMMRVHMAYVLHENKKLTTMMSTLSWLHDQVGILQGAYGHVKMLAEMARIDYGAIAKGLLSIAKLKKELSNEAEQPSEKPDGQKGEVLPSQGG